MPDRRMGLCDRLIGGAVEGVAIVADVLTSFWQTPREVEWAKAAADRPTWMDRYAAGYARSRPTLPNSAEAALVEREAEEGVAEPGCPRCSRLKCYCHIPAEPLLPGEIRGIRSLLQETSATTPFAESGPAEGEPPEPSAGVGAVCIVCFRPSGNCDCVERLFGPGLAHSAAVDPPASVPAAECSAPEFDWVTTAIPVIAGVLAEHMAEQHRSGPVLCHDGCGCIHAEFADWQDWRDHVAPHIAAALQTPRTATIYNIASGDRPRPLADFPKHQK